MKYTNSEECLSRLKKEYNRHKKLVIGFDFDNTIFDTNNEGFHCQPMIELLQECKNLGFILCLYTAEPSEERLKWKVDFCNFYGIKPDYINQSPLPGSTIHKPFFNLLLDDRAGLESSYYLLNDIIRYIKTQ